MTLADLARASGAKPRTLQLWGDAGVLRPVFGTDRKGSGLHRLFDLREMVLAIIISKFAVEQISIGILKAMSEFIRNQVNEQYELILKAVRGEVRLYYVIHTRWEDEGLNLGYALFDDENEMRDRVVEVTNDGSKASVLLLTKILKSVREYL